MESTPETMREIAEAKKAVEPFVGAMDCSMAVSAGGVFLAAIKRLGHDTRHIGGNPAAAKRMFHIVKRLIPPPPRPEPYYSRED